MVNVNGTYLNPSRHTFWLEKFGAFLTKQPEIPKDLCPRQQLKEPAFGDHWQIEPF